MADADRWSEAAHYFRQARALVERPSIVCNLGVALDRLGEEADAIEALSRCRDLAAADSRWSDANATVLALARRLLDAHMTVGRIRLTVVPRDSTVEVDGQRVDGTGAVLTMEVDPGSHVITARAPGFATRTEQISIPAGGEYARTWRLEPHPEESDRAVDLRDGEQSADDTTTLSEEPLFWIAIGAGVALVAVVVVLAVTLSPASDPLADYNGSTGDVLAPLRVAF